MNIQIRPAQVEDAAGIAHVHVDSWRTSYKGIVPDEVLNNLSYERREEMWRNGLSNPERTNYDFVAVDEHGRIVGFVTGGTLRDGDPSYESELYAIYLLKEVQGQGIGRRLMLTFVKRLLQNGITSMLLWVFEDNPSRKFYEAMGGQAIQSQPMEIGGVTMNEVAYGWRDIRNIGSLP